MINDPFNHYHEEVDTVADKTIGSPYHIFAYFQLLRSALFTYRIEMKFDTNKNICKTHKYARFQLNSIGT